MKRLANNNFVFVCGLVIAAFALCGIDEASAQMVRGFIRKSPAGALQLDVSAGQPAYNLVADRQQVANDLQKLKLGDFVVARGHLDNNDQTAHIEAIESLGLQELLGPWSEGSTRVFEFEDFSRLNLYRARIDGKGTALSKLKEIDYVITPESGNRYSIFMSDNRTVNVGTIEFEARGIRLSIIDSKTGRVSEKISLSPLPVK